jgi:hypothetical protein
VAGELTVAKLQLILDREGVDPASYNLAGGHYGDGYVLGHAALREIVDGEVDTWFVFTTERGGESERKNYATQDEACRYMLHCLGVPLDRID